jgi:hypothetical protein
MKRLLGSTALLLAITFSSKLIGFVRELILLESLGIGAELDVFVVLYGLVNLLSGALGICIVTSLTPIAGAYRTRADTRQLLLEGARMGALTGIAALAACIVYMLFAGQSENWPVALIVPLVVPFALIAEYQVALFLSRGQRVPVIAGNLIISLPLVAALLLFDLGIAAYAAGLAASFALRAAVFALLLLRGAQDESGGDVQPQSSLFGARLGRTLAGGSAMLAIAAVAVTAQMAAREIAEGQATIVAYGLKIPQFIITSVWFVLGTGFFAGLVTRGTGGAKRKIALYSAVNFAMAVCVFGAVLALPMLPIRLDAAGSSEILLVIAASIPFLPLIILTPLAEMTQRLLAASNLHRQVLAITAAILLGGFAAQAIALAAASLTLLAWSPAIGGALGAAVCAGLLLQLHLPQTSSEKISSHAPS